MKKLFLGKRTCSHFFKITSLTRFISFTLKWTWILKPNSDPILKLNLNFKIK
jgi:hypothetical protein